MKITSIVNGSTQLVIVPENDLEKEILKKLNGGSAVIISENNSILANNVAGGLLIKEASKES